MESVLGRYRNLIILVGVLFLQIMGLAVQVKRSADAENTRLIRIWAIRAITPLERGLVSIQNGAAGLWHNYFYLRGVRAENRQLKEQIEQMRLEEVRLKEDAAQAHRLQALLAFKEQFVSKTVAAQVIGASGSDLSRILYIDKGEDEGIKRDMAVITADGIVGKVLQVFPSVSQVLLINDQSSGVGAILEKSRLQGVLRGTANGEIMLERVMTDEQIVPGDVVLTSGGDQIFPKGLPVGIVSRVGSAKERKDLFLNIRIRPAANLSKLEEVLVVTEKQERSVTAQDTVRMRAADILAERLPSVPEKPATPGANAAGAKPAGSPNTAVGKTAGAKLQPKPVAPGGAPTGSATRAAQPSAAKPGPNRTPAATPPSAATVEGTAVSGENETSAVPGKPVPKAASDAIAPAVPSPDAAPSKPARSQTQPPSTPPQSNPQTPAPEDSPH